MSYPDIILIAIGLSMDAFAVSISMGLSVQKVTLKEIALPGLYFGFFQALMPVLGFYSGMLFAGIIDKYEHWVAFILLAFIGGKMIKDSFSKDENKSEYSFKFLKMLVLAIATSIDAFMVGISFAFFKINLLSAILIIGFTTLSLSMAGVKIGSVFGAKFGYKAEFAGGLVLVLIGVKILLGKLLF